MLDQGWGAFISGVPGHGFEFVIPEQQAAGDMVNHPFDILTVAAIDRNDRPALPNFRCIQQHLLQVNSDIRREIDLINNQQIALQ